MGTRAELEQLRRLAQLEAKKAAAQQKADALANGPVEMITKPFPRGGTVTEPAHPLQTMAEGAGAKMVRMGRMAPNLLIKAMNVSNGRPTQAGIPEWASDQAIHAQDKLDKPLMNTNEGTLGGIAGEVIPTLPMGLPRAAGLPGAMAEGGLFGGLTGDPETPAENVATGAGAAGVLHTGGRLLSRVNKGVVKKSAEAELLEMLAAQQGVNLKLPLSQAAQDDGLSGILKTVYGKILPSIPGSGSKLARQEAEAADSFRELAMREGAPDGTPHVPNGGKDVHTTIKTIGDEFERQYAGTIKSYAFSTPPPGDFANHIKGKIPNIDNTTLSGVSDLADNLVERYSNGTKVLDGDNLIRVKSELARLGREAPDERTGRALFEAQEYMDDLVRQQLSQGGSKQNLADLARYEALGEPWKNFGIIQKAAAKSKATGGKFTADELKSAIKGSSSDYALSRGSAPLQDLAEVGQDTVGKVSRSPSFLEKSLAWGGLGSLGLFGSLPGAAALWAGGKAVSSKIAQRALMGDTPPQRALVNAIRKYPRTAEFTKRAGARSIIADTEDSLNEQE